jgi:hypothetical protein
LSHGAKGKVKKGAFDRGGVEKRHWFRRGAKAQVVMTRVRVVNIYIPERFSKLSMDLIYDEHFPLDSSCHHIHCSILSILQTQWSKSPLQEVPVVCAP